MARAHGWMTLGVVVTLTLLSAPALAQTANFGLPVRPGQKVWITTTDGRTTVGPVSKLTLDAVEIGEGADRMVFEAAAVRRIQISDSLTNGALTGAAVFGLLGALFGAAADAATDIFATGIGQILGGAEVTSSGGTSALLGGLVGAGLGAAIGAGFDSMRRQTVYRAGDKVSVSVRPLVSDAGKGVGVHVRW